ncbi:hypothetical protein Mal64_02430 [Pseudobythopirellula maris]|uniref:Uncharacterized protein n=1 Tax=Pseudobythopirellula maris TaxID=2527991 RepID=A0A5C5ZSV6_9BACT|nr:hypothetical protein [Pseudobythopirellula maris]TWT89861.1 hypothetical protein Mal64_02430 [Pseudobythopirellula maris]
MWCRHCQQEVPGLGPLTSGSAQCARCRRPIGADSPAVEATVDPFDSIDDPKNAERLAKIDRTLRAAHSRVKAGPSSGSLRFDFGDSREIPGRSDSPDIIDRPPAQKRRAPAAKAAKQQAGSWAVAALGAGCLGLGVGLMLWSQVQARPELWNPALAATLVGQGLMILGLVQLASHLWTSSRAAAGKLGSMHDDLRRLQRTTDSLAGRQSGGAAGFYADLATGESPELLLANLKGQVDQLAARLGRC